jgi:hypothetical protein
MHLLRSLRRPAVLAAVTAVTMLAVISGCEDITPTGPLRAADVATVEITGSALLPGNSRALQLVPGATYRPTAVVRDRAGHANPRYPVDWASSKPAVFTVDSTGMVTARQAGEGVLTATARESVVVDSLHVFVVVATLTGGSR